jgi:hypothetical protein
LISSPSEARLIFRQTLQLHFGKGEYTNSLQASTSSSFPYL